MSDLMTGATIGGAAGSVVMAVAAVAAYLLQRGRAEGGIKTTVEHVTKTVAELQQEIETTITEVKEHADDAHARITTVIDNHHALREMIAREYVTYERMRELKSELMGAIKAQTDAMSSINNRLDKLMQLVARLPQQPERPQDE